MAGCPPQDQSILRILPSVLPRLPLRTPGHLCMSPTTRPSTPEAPELPPSLFRFAQLGALDVDELADGSEPDDRSLEHWSSEARRVGLRIETAFHLLGILRFRVVGKVVDLLDLIGVLVAV